MDKGGIARTAIWKKGHLVSRIFDKAKSEWVELLLIVVSVFVVAMAHWLGTHRHRPPVGVYIAIMGAVAALMIFHEKPSLREKAAWVILVTVLMVTEIQNIYTTDKEQSATFLSISQALDKTKDGLDATRQGIEAAAKRIEAANSGITHLSDESHIHGLELQQLHDALGPNGKQNIEKIETQIKRQIDTGGGVLGKCSSVSPFGQGGIPAHVCLDEIDSWTSRTQSYVLGSLGESYAARFDEAGFPNNLKSKRETPLDPRSLSQIEIRVLATETRINALKQFIGELEAVKQRPWPLQ
jgi:hypothetical protein